jgi:hypothetical protein
VAVALVAVLTAGCYESDFPLDPAPTADVDHGAIGTWRCLLLDADADEVPVTLTVSGGEGRRYQALWQEPGDAPDRYDVYASVLGGGTLLNVRERGDAGPTGSWTFLRYALMRPNVLHLQVVADTAMTGVDKAPAAVRAALERRSTDATLYSDVCICARVKAPR